MQGDEMIPKLERLPMVLALAAVLPLAAPACAPWGGYPGEVVLPSARVSYVSGEVRSVDARRHRIQLREYNGRTRNLSYDGRTHVVYRSRRYPVTALERGDRVQVRVVHGRGGNAWAERIEVRSSVRDSRVVIGRVERIDGVVGRVDRRNGYFTLDRTRWGGIRVQVPGRIRREDERRFERLRRGDRVRVEVRAIGRDRFELVRFR